MEKTKKDFKGEIERKGRGSRVFLMIVWFFKHISIATFKYLTITTIAVLIFLGYLTVYEFFVPEVIPTITPLTISDKELKIACSNSSSDFVLDFNEEECWKNIQPTLQILDKVCPAVSKWVREKHKDGKIIWEKENTDTYAKFDYINKKLIINRIMFLEIDGIKASILAHEFRHSRQNGTKFYRAIIAHIICRKSKNQLLLEGDAYLFENRVVIAIFLGRIS